MSALDPGHIRRLQREQRRVSALEKLRQELADGACDEVESIWTLFCNHLAPNFPASEYDVVDSIIRMFTQTRR